MPTACTVTRMPALAEVDLPVVLAHRHEEALRLVLRVCAIVGLVAGR